MQFAIRPQYEEQLDQLISDALREDVGEGDHSTLCCIPADAEGEAVLKIKQRGVLAGLGVARKVFHSLDRKANFEQQKNDGEEVEPGESAFVIRGNIHTILKAERLVLNIMQRMSGIASLTRQFCDRIKGFNAAILDTRKTTPNFRLLEKEAVRIGGGQNHRMGLYDMIMLKDNHIDFCGGHEKAIEKAHEYVTRYFPFLKIEIETRSLEEVHRVVKAGKKKVFRIMLDNFSTVEIRKAIEIIGNDFETEASGGITLDNVQEYAATGVNYLSVGALIHQARSIDLSLKASVL